MEQPLNYPEADVCQGDVPSTCNLSRRSSFSQEDSFLQSRLKMMEDSQKEPKYELSKATVDSQKELKHEWKAIVDSQTQTRQLIESLLANRLPEAPKLLDPRHGNQPTSILSHEQQLMATEGLTPSPDEVTHQRSRPERIRRDQPVSGYQTQMSQRETSRRGQIRSYSKDQQDPSVSSLGPPQEKESSKRTHYRRQDKTGEDDDRSRRPRRPITRRSGSSDSSSSERDHQRRRSPRPPKLKCFTGGKTGRVLFFSLRETQKSLVGLLPRNWKNLLII